MLQNFLITARLNWNHANIATPLTQHDGVHKRGELTAHRHFANLRQIFFFKTEAMEATPILCNPAHQPGESRSPASS
jgi:hypothetical protein